MLPRTANSVSYLNEISKFSGLFAEVRRRLLFALNLVCEGDGRVSPGRGFEGRELMAILDLGLRPDGASHDGR